MDKLVPVSRRALVQRINRKLALNGEALRKGRGRWADEMGYYIIDVNGNLLVAKDCDLVALGRELGVLRGWESVDWSES
ncbi:MAG: hypothetical protein ABSC13_06425 [Dehalococcoidia bacterium]|jgi:hypothetical protein